MENKKGFNRRDFLKIVGATTGAAATGCAKELPEKIIPYVVQPDEVIPGVATWYAAVCNECEAGCGTFVRTREGRALKVEGNPAHPVNRGGVCALGQSSIQSHYDPDRIREPLMRSVDGAFKPISWKEAIGMLAEGLSLSKKTAVVTAPHTGSLPKLIGEFNSKLGNSEHYNYSVIGRKGLDSTIAKVFGENLFATYDFSKADTIVNFGADFLGTWVSPVEFTKDYSKTRVPGADGKISTFFHFEPRLSQTAANSDKWFRIAAGSDTRVLLALALTAIDEKGASGSAAATLRGMAQGRPISDLLMGSGVSEKDLKKVAKVLAKSKSPLVLAGDQSEGESQIVAHLLSSALGSLGTTLVLKKHASKPAKDFADLVEDLNAKTEYGVVLISDVNPVFSMPQSANVTAALANAKMVVAVSSMLDETASMANLILPLSSSFESWGDTETRPGVFGLNQPSMTPLYQTQTLGDTLIAALANEKLGKPLGEFKSFEDYIKDQWKSRTGAAGFDKRWQEYVKNGGEWSGAKNIPSVSPSPSAVQVSQTSLKKATSETISLLAFSTVHLSDGKSANRPWAQEVPDPMSTAVWGSWLEIHPDLAEEKGLKHGKVAQLISSDNKAVEIPVYVTKNIHPRSVATPIGQGHTTFGRFANGVGANPLSILPLSKFRGAAEFHADSVNVRKSVANDELITVQGNDSQLERGFLRTVSDSELKKGAGHHGEEHHVDDHHGDEHAGGDHGAHGDTHGLEFHHHDLHALGPQKEPKQMYKQMEHVQYRWGMSVDLAKCTGCTACVTACYAENNIAVVGKEFCAQGREMSWIRVSRYIDDNDDQPVTGFQPMMCQHCGNAPCEPVCPVYATYHSDEGLNTMVYNRCVGTRYCSNNCSYKVRRFNWFDYDWPEPLNWQLNPDVTVRTVGVMEKCSFCIQRIREGENIAKNEGREVKDGEIQPACAATCPADAIVFGNLNDESSKVAEKSRSERGYKVLDAELNTQPGVTYLAKVTHSKEAHK